MPSNYSPTPLGELADLLAGAATKSARPGSRGGLVDVLTVRALRDGRIDPGEVSRARPLTSETARYRVATGDVLVPARSTFFTAAVVTPELHAIMFNSTLIRIRCNDRLHPRVLAAYLRHPAGLAAVEAISQSGAVQMNITVRAMRELLIQVPPHAEQERLASMLEAADSAYSAALQSAERRRRLAGDVVMHAMAGADH
ncbi:MAG: hypothetical protein Tsb0013_03110 [Phycisphaerales bacterium]